MATTAPRPMSAEEKKVIFASSLGTVFEWYDFYLYGSLAAIIAKQFFSDLHRGCFAQLRQHWRGRSRHPDLLAPVARPGFGW